MDQIIEENKKLLVLGAGENQVPVIEKANELNLETFVVDPYPNSPGKDIADNSYEIDLLQVEEVLNLAKKLSVDGVVTYQSDLPIPAVGKVNDKLKLNGISYSTARWVSNKLALRKRFKNKGIPQPEFEITKSKTETRKAAKKLGFPCVVKAGDSSGSRGITKVSNLGQIEAAVREARKYSRNSNSILVEKYIDGLEFGAQTFSINGRCVCVFLHNDTLSSPPNMVPTGHSFPFRYLSKREQDNVIEVIKRAVEALKITDGPANIDLILERDTKKINILEIGARGGATCLNELVEYHTGIKWLEVTIMSALGEEVELEVQQKKPVAALILTSPKDGIYKGFNYDGEKIEKEIIDFELSVRPGERVRKFENGSHRIGKVLAIGEDAKNAEKNVQRFVDNLTIRVD